MARRPPRMISQFATLVAQQRASKRAAWRIYLLAAAFAAAAALALFDIFR